MKYLALFFISSYASACLNTKMCCLKDFYGNLSCVTVCKVSVCPSTHPIVVD